MAHLNADWHRAHVLGSHASLADRVAWHLEHLRECGCRRDLPASVRAELERRGLAVPDPRADGIRSHDRS